MLTGHNSVWTSTVFDNVLLSQFWLSGLRLYLRSDRDKTLQIHLTDKCQFKVIQGQIAMNNIKMINYIVQITN